MGPAAPGTSSARAVPTGKSSASVAGGVPVVGIHLRSMIVRCRFYATLFKIREAIDHVVGTALENEYGEMVWQHRLGSGGPEPADSLPSHLEHGSDPRKSAAEPWAEG